MGPGLRFICGDVSQELSLNCFMTLDQVWLHVTEKLKIRWFEQCKSLFFLLFRKPRGGYVRVAGVLLGVRCCSLLCMVYLSSHLRSKGPAPFYHTTLALVGTPSWGYTHSTVAHIPLVVWLPLVRKAQKCWGGEIALFFFSPSIHMLL